MTDLSPNLELLKQHYPFDDYASGAHNVWVTSHDSGVGLKLFFKQQHDPKRFLAQPSNTENKMWARWVDGRRPMQYPKKNFGKAWDLANEEDLAHMFEIMMELYDYDLHPKPIEIFKSSIFTGVIIGKAIPLKRRDVVDWKSIPREKRHSHRHELDSHDIYNNRATEMQHYNELPRILGKQWANYVMNTDQRANYGIYEGKLMLLDVDYQKGE